MDKLLSGLALAAVSALTFIAYKHPNAYRKIFWGIGVGYVALVLCGLSWHLGSWVTFGALVPFFDVTKIQEAKVVGNYYLISPWVYAAVNASMLYLSFLMLLPNLLSEDKP